MNETPNNSKPRSDARRAMALNRSWVFSGSIPFILSFLLAVVVRNPLLFLAPLYGFCPLDIFHDQSVPSTGQLLLWGYGSIAGCLAFGVYAYFVRPFGMFFALTIWASTLMLLFRMFEAFKDID
jgi:hypothetical protein